MYTFLIAPGMEPDRKVCSQLDTSESITLHHCQGALNHHCSPV